MASFPIQEVHKLSVGKKTTSWHRFLRLVSIFFDILIKFKIKNIMPKVPIKVNIREEETILRLK